MDNKRITRYLPLVFGPLLIMPLLAPVIARYHVSDFIHGVAIGALVGSQLIGFCLMLRQGSRR